MIDLLMERKRLWWILGCMLLIGFISVPFLAGRFKSQSAMLPISGKCIVVDAGHGGLDGGAVGKGGLIEKEVTLKVACFLRDYLQEAGAYVIMTREDDTELTLRGKVGRKATDLRRRVELTEEKEADILVSIHTNAIPLAKCSGAQTFFNPTREENQKLATHIQEELKRSLENTSRQPSKKNDVYILREAKKPTALVEVGFISHPEEAKLLGTEAYQRKVAVAMYYGIAKYFLESESPANDEE